MTDIKSDLLQKLKGPYNFSFEKINLMVSPNIQMYENYLR